MKPKRDKSDIITKNKAPIPIASKIVSIFLGPLSKIVEKFPYNHLLFLGVGGHVLSLSKSTPYHLLN